MSSPNATTRSAELVRNLPLATAGTIGLCCSVYVSQIVLDINVRLFTMCPRRVLHLHEFYRIVTSCFFHGSLMHIGMNMLSTAAISAMIERRMGTLNYIMTCLWAVFMTGFFYCIIAVAAQVLLGKDDLMYQHSLGFSGIMFHLLMLESNLNPHASRSIFGFVAVPSWAYPIVMLVLMQLMIPGNISFTGHLCGILSGTLHLYGLLDCVLVNDSYLQEMEQWSMLRPFTAKENFVATTASSGSGSSNCSSQSSFRRDPRHLLRNAKSGVQLVFRLIWNVLETFQVAILGRGQRANANIDFSSDAGRILRNPWAGTHRRDTELVVVVDDDGNEDEEWGGLPLIDRQSKQQQGRPQQSQLL